MTPERLAEIRELADNTAYDTLPIVRSALLELLAEIATLKGEVERLQMIALCGDKSHLLVIRERDTLRSKLDALVTAAEKVVSREQHAIDGDTFPDDQLLDTVIELGDYRALSAALVSAVEDVEQSGCPECGDTILHYHKETPDGIETIWIVDGKEQAHRPFVPAALSAAKGEVGG